MKKLLPLVFGLMVPLASFADDFTDQAVDFCRSKGGSHTMSAMVPEGNNYCRQVTCKKTNASDGSYEIKDGAPGPEANVEATKKVCIPKAEIDGKFDGKSTSGSSGGACRFCWRSDRCQASIAPPVTREPSTPARSACVVGSTSAMVRRPDLRESNREGRASDCSPVVHRGTPEGQPGVVLRS